MPKLELTVGQVIELVKQLPQKDKFAVLHALNPERETGPEDQLKREEEKQLRTMSAQRGLDWDRLSEDDREIFVEKLLQKDR
jgi:hypothetical protein